MLEGIIATAEKIKNGNPYSRFIVVSENYDVDLSVDPAYSRIAQIYVLRKCKRKEEWTNIDYKVMIRFVNEVKVHIKRPWSDVETKMRNEGVIIIISRLNITFILAINKRESIHCSRAQK